MATQSINRDQIIREIALELDIPRSRVKKILIELEKEIILDLQESGKVRLEHFGMFYLLQRKSRVIKQIRTKSSRLLLEQKTVKFRSSPELKKILSPGGQTGQVPLSITKPAQSSLPKTTNPIVKIAPKSQPPVTTNTGESGVSIPISKISDSHLKVDLTPGQRIPINKTATKISEEIQGGKIPIRVNDLRDLEYNAKFNTLKIEKSIEELPKVVKVTQKAPLSGHKKAIAKVPVIKTRSSEENIDFQPEIFREPIKVVRAKTTNRLELKPVQIHTKVDRERVRQEISKRFKALALRQKSQNIEPITRPSLDTSAEGKLFGALFKSMLKSKVKVLSLSLNNEENIPIYQNKPRKKITDLPQVVVKRFLKKYLDFDVFNIPQERFVKVSPSSKIKEKITIKAFSMPTADGASFNLVLEKV